MNEFNNYDEILRNIFESLNKEEDITDIRNLNSWLLNFTPESLVIISAVLALLISRDLSIEEQAIIGSFLTSLADNIFLISAQQALIKVAFEEQKAIIERQKEKSEKDELHKELKNIKTQLLEIEKKLENQLKV